MMKITGAMTATIVLAATFATAAETSEAKIKQLQAENDRLRTALAQSQKHAEDLQAALAQGQEHARNLERRLDKLTAELAQLRRRSPTGAKSAPVMAHKLQIRVTGGNWGGAGTADIEKVLRSAAGELWKHFPDRKLAPIIVERSTSGPIALYRKGPNGEHIVRLDVGGRYWCQFAYQFAHEFCHILTNYRPGESKKNNWFVESLCETASLYAIRQMAETWKTAPPYPHWKSYSSALAKYAEDARVKPELRVNREVTLAKWYRLNAKALRAKATIRERNKVFASELLTVLEADPAAWRAASCLNLSAPGGDDSFKAFLADWLARTPAAHKKTVQRIIDMFELDAP